jgi:hypothetical protein
MHRASIALGFGLLALTFGCNTAKLTPQTEKDASCPIQIEYPCKAGAPGSGGCTADPASTDPLESAIAPDASYPSGCTVFVPNPTPDETGNCIINGSCRCTTPDGGTTPKWTCSPP